MKEEVLIWYRHADGDETNRRYASISIVAARHRLFNDVFRRVSVFTPSPIDFHVGPSCGFKGSGGLVESASSLHAIGCLCCILTTVGVASGEAPLQSVFVFFPRCPSVTTATG